MVVVAALLALLGSVTIGALVPGMFWLVIVSGLLFEAGAALWFVSSTARRRHPHEGTSFRLPHEAGAGATSRIA